MAQPSPTRFFSVPILSQETWHTKKRYANRTYKQFTLIALLLLSLLFSIPPMSWSHGGTNGLFDRMLQMTNNMEQTGEMTQEDAFKMKLKIQELRGKVDQRMLEEGSISPNKDKDLYEEIDSFNKPLFDAYQKSKAKNTFDPRKNINRFR